MSAMQAALVRSILEQFRSYEWTAQGFGFARTKIADVGRIHVWDSRLATQLVSTMHTHPWPLRSTVISGELINVRYVPVPHGNGLPYVHSRIATGEGGGLIGDPEPALMAPTGNPELYLPGDTYEQRPDEIHRTLAESGTVTLIERPQGPPLEEADTYWPAGTVWVSAEPREIPLWELEPVIGYALARWNSQGITTALTKTEGPEA